MQLGRLFAIFTAVFVLLVASPAFGQSVQQDGYEDEAAQVQEQVAGLTSGEAGAGAGAGDNGALPFTGLDLGLMVVAAGGLFVVGLGMRRLARAPHSP
jgi:hypothetical protein